MKTHLIPVLVAVIIALFAGCKEDEVAASATPRPPLGTPFSKGAWDYATNHFFVDTLYRGAYEAYYRNDPPVLSPGIQIVDEEVWVKSVLPPVSSVRTGVAFITLPAQPAQGYDSTLRALNEVPGERESALFVRRTEQSMKSWGRVTSASFLYEDLTSLRTRLSA